MTPAPGAPASPWRAPAPGARAFPPEFVFGVAASGYQIEGATHAEGRVDSIWDAFARRPGAIADGSSADVAVDHYHRHREDSALMGSLGIGAYRFSTSWSRIMPEPGRVNRAGLDFYDRVVDGMLEAGVTPWLTLYHWDMPQTLEEAGGWRVRESADWFTEYALATHAALGDRVRNWLTLNEPWCTACLGYGCGEHAPGLVDDVAALRAVHHLLLAHGRATRALRAADPELTIGFAPNYSLYSPLDPDDPADVDVARRLGDLQYGCFVEPVLTGAYPRAFLADVADRWPADLVQPGDLAEIAAPIDVLGVNYYNSWIVAAPEPDATPEPRERPSPWQTAPDARWVRSQAPRTSMDWEVHPGAFRDLLLRLQQLVEPTGTYLIVTENGSGCPDDRVVDGVVDDGDRIAYLRDHLAALHEAMAEGADVRAYLLWTFLDNWEWAEGFTKTFGLVHVDPVTLARTPKRSAHWYADLISTRTLPEPD